MTDNKREIQIEGDIVSLEEVRADELSYKHLGRMLYLSDDDEFGELTSVEFSDCSVLMRVDLGNREYDYNLPPIAVLQMTSESNLDE